ncbi:MAG: beta-ketoacyl-[acyl-carrier-protein] synthase II [Dehalococcoidia bacterium]|nr:beta-ketoacyl-[acyl-carrier-protein] synthase II [Dehalococcoidia bacterium]
MDQKRRVVVTGLGVMSPLGETVDEFWNGLVAGKSGVGPLTLCDPTDLPCRICGEVKHFDPLKYLSPKDARRMARFSQLAVAGAMRAAEHAHLDVGEDDQGRLGVVYGVGIGGFPVIQEQARLQMQKGVMRISPFLMPMMLPNLAAGNVSRVLGLKGYTSTITTACAAGTQAVGEAAEVIRRGDADVIVAGGAEAGICELGIAGFCIIRALSTRNEEPERASRPFDASRDGFVPGEGSASLVLESLEHALARGAKPLAEIASVGVSSDAYHEVQPDETGGGALRAMQQALKKAGVTPQEVDYINAHGTSTPLNDAIETKAIKRLFGEHAYKIPISSTKSMIGHTLGASGAIEAVACVMTIQSGTIHPTINYEKPDPACDLDYVPNIARRKEVRTVLSNSFGFGGQNACLVIKKFEE